ncbi:MAG TPA: ribonuclease Z [Gemmatimonadaceae bacterium]|nr:ribonuclease Z [Gemmatimonadaceae bacterium]
MTVGTGTAAPHPRRVQSGALIETGDVRLLVDCGSGVVFRMSQLGLAWDRLTHVAITHFHADHTSDVATLIYGWRYGLLPPREAPVEIIGPPGLAARLAGMMAAFGDGLLESPPPLAVVEMPPGSERPLAAGVVLASRTVPHTEESVAYSVSGHGRRVVVTGDTGLDAGLGAWAAECDVLLCECSLPDALALPHHLTPRQCGVLAASARPRLLALTHFYPPVELEDILGQVAESFTGRVALCEDGWSYSSEAR